jgi:hypothetical protein
MSYEGPLRILKTEGLSADEAEVEARFAELVQTRLDEIVAEYGARFGRVINTDLARDFSSDYRDSNLAKTRFSRAVYQPAKALADEIYRREIRKAAPAEEIRILFTSGGAGAGKSTALDFLSKQLRTNQYDIFVDGSLSDYPVARTKIWEALALGHSLTVMHVFRAFAEAIPSVVKRAIATGRVVTLDNIAATHFRSGETLLKLVEEFGARIRVRVLENRVNESPRLISVPEFASRRGDSIDRMREMAHNIFHDDFASFKSDHPEIYEAFVQEGSGR